MRVRNIERISVKFKRVFVLSIALILCTSFAFANTGYLGWGKKINYDGYYVVQSLEPDTKKFYLRMIVVSDDIERGRYELIYRDSWDKRFKKGDRIKIRFSNDGRGWVATFWKNKNDWVCCFEIYTGTHLGDDVLK